MTLTEEQLQDRMEQGGVRALVTFELVGKPKEHVTETLNEYVQQIRDEKEIHIMKSEVADVIELEGEDEGLFSSFAEIDMVLPSMAELTFLTFNLMPASVEIMEPASFTFEHREMQNWLNDILAQQHQVGMHLRAERQKVSYLRQNIENLIRNTLTLLLAKKPSSVSELARLSGLPEEEVDRVLQVMKEADHVVEDNEQWTLNSQEK